MRYAGRAGAPRGPCGETLVMSDPHRRRHVDSTLYSTLSSKVAVWKRRPAAAPTRFEHFGAKDSSWKTPHLNGHRGHEGDRPDSARGNGRAAGTSDEEPHRRGIEIPRTSRRDGDAAVAPGPARIPHGLPLRFLRASAARGKNRRSVRAWLPPPTATRKGTRTTTSHRPGGVVHASRAARPAPSPASQDDARVVLGIFPLVYLYAEMFNRILPSGTPAI